MNDTLAKLRKMRGDNFGLYRRFLRIHHDIAVTVRVALRLPGVMRYLNGVTAEAGYARGLALQEQLLEALGVTLGEAPAVIKYDEAWLTCRDCDAWPDMYVVFNHVWEAAGMDRGHLCLQCLEKRLKRPLTLADFPISGTSQRDHILNRHLVPSGLPPKEKSRINNALLFGYFMAKREGENP